MVGRETVEGGELGRERERERERILYMERNSELCQLNKGCFYFCFLFLFYFFVFKFFYEKLVTFIQ